MANNPFLEGNYAPVTDETTAFDLPIRGEIPRELAGRLLRIGPNPIVPPGEKHHWFSGNGFVHGLGLRDGKAQWYRSRFVRDDEVCKAKEWPACPGPRFSPLSSGGANTNVIAHAGRTFAIVEAGGNPVELTEELETVGTSDFEGTLPGPFSAHPKCDPETGELHVTGYFFGWDHLQYIVVGTDGHVRKTVDIPVAGRPMIHDCAITKNYFIVFDFPVLFTPEMIEQGYSLPYRWHDDHGARVGLLPREGNAADITWHEVAPCFVFHPMNAFEDTEGRVVLDVVRYQRLFVEDDLEVEERSQSLERWLVDPRGGPVKEECLDERPQEFPRIDERLVGQPYRYGYCGSSDHEGLFGGLLKHDLATGTRLHRDEGEGRLFQEPVFVPRSDDASEDDGWIMAYVHDKQRNAADVVVLHAQDFLGEPVATIELPARVPFGFHGNWAPDDV